MRSQQMIFSDSEIYASQPLYLQPVPSSQMAKQTSNNMTVADEYTYQDKGVGDRVGNYDDSRILQSFIAEIPSGGHDL